MFYDRAMKMGADFVATGHYARTSFSDNFLALLTKSNFSARHGLSAGHPRARKIYLARSVKLLKAVDQNKDQTYFLYTLKKEQLPKIIFPVGGLEKSEVRKLAKKFGLQNAEKKDSQGVCFVGPLNMKNFLKKSWLPEAVVIFGLDKDITCAREAKRKGIKIISIVDTNVNPDIVDYIIPANDDAISAVRYIIDKIKEQWLQLSK